MPEQMIDMEWELNRDRKDPATPFFKLVSKVDERESKLAGKTIYKDVEMVDIVMPGDRTLRVYEPVNENHKRRWPNQYKAFKDGIEQTPDGYPINQWPFMTPALAATLKGMNCHTIEQFVQIPDAAIMDLPRAMELRDKARKFIADREDSTAVNRLTARLDEATNQLSEKTKLINELNARLDVLEKMNRDERDEAPVKRGRPRKAG